MSVEKINELKIKIFDLNEVLEERRNFEGQFFGALADLLDIPADSRQDPQVYINAIIALKEKVPADVEIVDEGEAVAE